ncbi:MAG: hypothetical protein ABJL98_02825 [Lentilitoribacter sp.]
MIFNEWSDRVERLTGLSGHGSRKRIAEKLGLTSETIKNAEKTGEASKKMMKVLRSIEGESREVGFEKLMGEAGRWNVSHAIGGVVVTHVQSPFAFTAFFNQPIYEQDYREDWRSMRVRVIAYDQISGSQLADLVDEARELAARRMKLID